MDIVPRPLQGLAIGSAATVIGPCEAGAAQFAAQRAILFDGAISGDFLAMLLALGERARFVSDTVAGLGHREIETPPLAGAAIGLALQRPQLLRWLETVTGRGPLLSVDGRVVQTRPAPDDALAWHDDCDRPRALAVTIGLSPARYDGGAFEMREKASGALLLRHRHVAAGQMLVFEVADDLEHRVLPLSAGGPRRVYTGWFLETPR